MKKLAFRVATVAALSALIGGGAAAPAFAVDMEMTTSAKGNIVEPGETFEVSNLQGSECIDAAITGDVVVVVTDPSVGATPKVDNYQASVEADGTWRVELTAPTVDTTLSVEATCSATKSQYVPLDVDVVTPKITGPTTPEPSPDPTDPDPQTPLPETEEKKAPAAPAESDLTEANQGNISVGSISGDSVSLNVGADRANETLWGTVFSEPRALGERTVNLNGDLSYELPGDLPVGWHRIAVQDVNGNIVGWVRILKNADGSWSTAGAGQVGGGVSLAETGASNNFVAALLALTAVCIGAGAIGLRRKLSS